MKELPSYKIIEIKSWNDLEQLRDQNEINNNKHPILINLEKLSPISSEHAHQLEQVLQEIFQSLYYPYPVYCIGKVHDYVGPITFYDSKSTVPKFYPYKLKSTSKIHSELLHYNQIAQREFDCINYKKANESIAQYADIQKKIYIAHCELTEINKILKKSGLKIPEDSGGI